MNRMNRTNRARPRRSPGPIATLLALVVTSSACGPGEDDARPVAGAGSSTGRPEPASGPNIVLVLTDDQRADAVGYAAAGGPMPFLSTPAIDRLAWNGVVFDNAFVTTSLCCPGRASILTGLYASVHAVRSNEHPLPAGVELFPGRLRRHGYETAFVGKWHIGGDDSERPRPEFDYWVGLPGQGAYVDPELNVAGRRLERSGYVTDILTEYALEFIDRPRDRPFFLLLSHKAPHPPVSPAPRHERLWEEAAVPLPLTVDEPLGDKPDWFEKAHNHDGFKHWLSPRPKLVEYIRDYARTLAAVDESLGRVIERIDARGLTDETVVLFTSDNGHFLGEHRLYSKMLMYEESIRVPLVVRHPAAEPARRLEIALNVDLAPTILEIAGLDASQNPAPARSLLPLVLGQQPVDWRRSFRYEYLNSRWGLPSLEGVWTESGWKYVRYPDWEQLFYLPDDPFERDNLATRAEHTERRLELIAELERLGGGGQLDPPSAYRPLGGKPSLGERLLWRWRKLTD